MAERATVRRRIRGSLIVALLAVGAASIVFSGVGVAAAATIEATNSTSAWSPNTANITTAESVTFKNSSMSLPHGVHWNGPPATPSCTNVPVDSSGTNWNGDCSFSQAGSYPFVCTVHPAMTGTVTVTSSGPGAPIVSTSAAASVNDTAATLKGSVNPNGLATEYFFKYGTTASYGTETGKTSVPAGTSPVSASTGVTGLAAATTYHFRLFAENTSGTSEGADLTFTTTGPPLATTSTATAVSDTEATLRGSVTPRGHATIYFFKYGETASYGQETSVKSAGSGTTSTSVSAPLTGLSPETTYHFQLVANNSSGEATGSDQTFTTTSTPPPPPPDPLPPPTTPVTPPPPVDEGPALGSAIKVVAGRNGAPVRGSVQVLQAGAGGRLEVELLPKGGGSKGIAGRTVRNGVPSGTVSFSVALNARAKGTLRRKHRLPLIVRIELTPPGGAAVTVTKSLLLRA